MHSDICRADISLDGNTPLATSSPTLFAWRNAWLWKWMAHIMARQNNKQTMPPVVKFSNKRAFMLSVSVTKWLTKASIGFCTTSKNIYFIIKELSPASSPNGKITKKMFAIHSLYHAVHRRFKLNFTSKTKLVHKRRTDIRLLEANKHTTPLSPWRGVGGEANLFITIWQITFRTPPSWSSTFITH